MLPTLFLSSHQVYGNTRKFFKLIQKEDEKSIGTIVYDDGCHFLKYSSKPEKRGVDPEDDVFAGKKFYVDYFHYRHSC